MSNVLADQKGEFTWIQSLKNPWKYNGGIIATMWDMERDGKEMISNEVEMK